MLFLLRPRQTWIPYALPRSREQQDAYNRQLEDAYTSTRRVGSPPANAEPSASDPIHQLQDLARLRDSGALSEAEFTALKAKVLGDEGVGS